MTCLQCGFANLRKFSAKNMKVLDKGMMDVFARKHIHLHTYHMVGYLHKIEAYVRVRAENTHAATRLCAYTRPGVTTHTVA